MKVFETEQEKQSFAITLITFVALMLLMYFLKSSGEVVIQQLEGGGGGGDVAVNFGDSELGKGDNFTNTEHVRQAAKPVPQTPVAAKEIITSDDDDAPSVADIKKPVQTPKKADEKPIVKPVVPKQPQPSNATRNALDDLLKGSDKSGDGNDNVGGNKGKAYGDANATGYNGGGGSGTGSGGGNGSGQGIGNGSGYGSGSGSGRGSGVGNYQLDGRKVLTKPQPGYTCNEQGKVAVKIWVDRSGNVVRAEAGDRGTTNAAACLATQAVMAAKETKFQANADSPETQVGRIIYSFRLTQ
jgi:outer membrane biosynthesis protein TonB